MKKMGRRAAAFALALGMVLGLTACGGSGESDVTTLVQGNIDEIYLGKFDEDYLKMVDSTEEEAMEAYLDGLEVEAEYFANYWGIVVASYGESYDDLDEDLKQSIVDLYKEIYSRSKYEVQPATKQSDGSYAVKVLVEPIDIMDKAVDVYMNDEFEPLNEFFDRYTDEDFAAMSDEEYQDYTNEYGRLIVQLVQEQLPNLGYMDQKSQAIQVEEVDNVLSINSDDWGIFDSYVIYYP